MDTSRNRRGPVAECRSGGDSLHLAPDQMLLIVKQALRENLPTHDVTASPQDPGIVVLVERASGCAAARLDVTPLLQDLCRSRLPEARIAERIAAFVSRAQDALNPEVLDPARLYPALRGAACLASLDLEALTRPGPGDLNAVLLEAGKTRLTVVTPERAEEARLSITDAWERAEDNLFALLKDLTIEETGPGLFQLEITGNPMLGSTLLIVSQVLREALNKIGARRALLACPGRGSVDLVDADAPRALCTLQDWMGERLNGPRPQSEMVFGFDRDAGALMPCYFYSTGALHPLC